MYSIEATPPLPTESDSTSENLSKSKLSNRFAFKTDATLEVKSNSVLKNTQTRTSKW